MRATDQTLWLGQWLPHPQGRGEEHLQQSHASVGLLPRHPEGAWPRRGQGVSQHQGCRQPDQSDQGELWVPFPC